MDTKELKSAIEKAQEAVSGVTDESLKKIAFQKALDTLLIAPIITKTPETQDLTFSTPTKSTPAKVVPNNNETLQESLTEFINSKNQKSHFNIVLAMAYYIHFQVREDFSIDDIRKGYKSSLIPPSKNITDIINQNIRKGLIVKADKKKEGKQAYHITKSGIDYVNSDFKLKLKYSQPKPKAKSIEKENVRNTPKTIGE